MALKFFAYSCHCSVDTELIDRKNNAINCINCVLICSEVYRQFSSPFALENTPGQWSRCTENRMPTFCKFQQHLFRNVVPGSLWTVLGRIPLLLRTWSNKLDHCPIPNLLANTFTDSAFLKHSSLLSLLSQEMSLNIDINRILPVKVAGVCPKLLRRSWCLGTLRHAQVQHAQQSVPCLVVIVWRLCTHRCMAQVFPLRVRLVCPAFALLVGRTSCFRRGLHVEMTCFSVAVFAATPPGTSGQDSQLADYDTAGLRLTKKHSVCTEDNVSYTRIKCTCSTSICTVERSRKCLWIQGYDRQERRGFDDNLDPAAAFQSPSKPAAFLPVVFWCCHAVLVQLEPRPRSSCRRLLHWRSSDCGISSGPLTERCTTESQVSALFWNLRELCRGHLRHQRPKSLLVDFCNLGNFQFPSVISRFTVETVVKIVTSCESPVRVFVSGVSLFMLISRGVTRMAWIIAHSPSTSTLTIVGILIGTGLSEVGGLGIELYFRLLRGLGLCFWSADSARALNATNTTWFCTNQGYSAILENPELRSICSSWLLEAGQYSGIGATSSLIGGGVNALLKFLFVIMAEEERPLSVSELHNLIVRNLFNAQFINSALIITLVIAISASSSSGVTSRIERGWFSIVGAYRPDNGVKFFHGCCRICRKAAVCRLLGRRELRHSTQSAPPRRMEQEFLSEA